MTTVLIVVHLMIVVAMIGLVLLQRSEGGALGIGGGGGGAFMTGRSAGNALTTTTAFLAAAFFATSIGLAFLSKLESGPSDIFDTLPGQTAPVAGDTPAPPLPGSGTSGTAERMLEQLGGGSSAGPQTTPAEGGASSGASSSGEGDTLPVPEGGAVPLTPPVEGE